MRQLVHFRSLPVSSLLGMPLGPRSDTQGAGFAIPIEAREPLGHFLCALGDDAFLLGHRSAEWTGLGPILEEDIAFSSMAQDEMGHALVWYGLLGDLGWADPDTIVYGRHETRDWRNARLYELPRGDYAYSLMRQYLADLGQAIRYDALIRSTETRVSAAATKLRQEEKYHLVHGRTLIERLAKATPESRARLQKALDELFPYALGIWEATAGEASLVALGLTAPSTDLEAAWTTAACAFLAEVGLAPPADLVGGVWQTTVQPQLGGRQGQHGEDLRSILDAMQMLRRADPEAIW